MTKETKLSKIQYVTVTEQQVENYRKFFMAMAKDIRVLMIKLETHCHIYGTSSCATTPNDLLISRYKERGYGAILVTNHFSEHCYNDYFKGDTLKQKIDYFFECYDNFAKDCKLAGVKTFRGAEIRTPHPKQTGGKSSGASGPIGSVGRGARSSVRSRRFPDTGRNCFRNWKDSAPTRSW